LSGNEKFSKQIDELNSIIKVYEKRILDTEKDRKCATEKNESLKIQINSLSDELFKRSTELEERRRDCSPKSRRSKSDKKPVKIFSLPAHPSLPVFTPSPKLTKDKTLQKNLFMGSSLNSDLE
jgi:hypothetical protein